MHFVGNRAISLGDGELEIQLYYDQKYSVLSAILPIIPIFVGLSVAVKFYEVGRGAVVRFGSLVVCGLCTGGASTLLYFLGNEGIMDFHMLADWKNMLGAAAIAVVACSVGFGLFFYWGKLWMNNVWRRIFVSLILAVGVSG
jgi:NO-binding membrane sensor protein with MHYT domain